MRPTILSNEKSGKAQKDVMTLIDTIGKKIAFMFIRNKKGENKLS